METFKRTCGPVLATPSSSLGQAEAAAAIEEGKRQAKKIAALDKKVTSLQGQLAEANNRAALRVAVG